MKERWFKKHKEKIQAITSITNAVVVVVLVILNLFSNQYNKTMSSVVKDEFDTNNRAYLFSNNTRLKAENENDLHLIIEFSNVGKLPAAVNPTLVEVNYDPDITMSRTTSLNFENNPTYIFPGQNNLRIDRSLTEALTKQMIKAGKGNIKIRTQYWSLNKPNVKYYYNMELEFKIYTEKNQSDTILKVETTIYKIDINES